MNFLSVFLIGFALSAVIAPFVIKLCARLKFGQNIYHYVESHKSKQGTPTMGGIIFILAGAAASLFFIDYNVTGALVVLAVFAGYGILGFLDDFIKIKFKQNLGLRAYQKIIGQVAIALIVALYVYLSPNISKDIILPFSDIKINLGWFLIPFIMLVFLAATNSVNLTDGLDGLAGGTTMVYLLGFAGITYIYTSGMTAGLEDTAIAANINIILICLAVAGALLGFLIFNSYPAKIFMGDTGSLALGAIVAASAAMNGLSLYIIIMGFMFVLSSVSVIIQVLYYKKTKKRVFLMAPLHHHFEKCGVHESKITVIYIVITVVLCIGSALLTMAAV